MCFTSTDLCTIMMSKRVTGSFKKLRHSTETDNYINLQYLCICNSKYCCICWLLNVKVFTVKYRVEYTVFCAGIFQPKEYILLSHTHYIINFASFLFHSVFSIHNLFHFPQLWRGKQVTIIKWIIKCDNEQTRFRKT